MTKYSLYDGIFNKPPAVIEAKNIIQARAYVVKWVGGTMSELSGILIVQGKRGKALGEVRGSPDGKLRWCPRTVSSRGYPTYKWAYRLNKDGTLGKKLGRL